MDDNKYYIWQMDTMQVMLPFSLLVVVMMIIIICIVFDKYLFAFVGHVLIYSFQIIVDTVVIFFVLMINFQFL